MPPKKNKKDKIQEPVEIDKGPLVNDRYALIERPSMMVESQAVQVADQTIDGFLDGVMYHFRTKELLKQIPERSIQETFRNQRTIMDIQFMNRDAIADSQPIDQKTDIKEPIANSLDEWTTNEWKLEKKAPPLNISHLAGARSTNSSGRKSLTNGQSKNIMASLGTGLLNIMGGKGSFDKSATKKKQNHGGRERAQSKASDNYSDSRRDLNSRERKQLEEIPAGVSIDWDNIPAQNKRLHEQKGTQFYKDVQKKLRSLQIDELRKSQNLEGEETNLKTNKKGTSKRDQSLDMYDPLTGKLLVEQEAINRKTNILQCRDGSEFAFSTLVPHKENHQPLKFNKTGHKIGRAELLENSLDAFQERRKQIIKENYQGNSEVLSAVMLKVMENKQAQPQSLVAHANPMRSMANTISKVQRIHHEKEVNPLNDNRNAPPPKKVQRQLFEYINDSVLDKDPAQLASAKSIMPTDTQTTFIEKKKIITDQEEVAVPWTNDDLRKLAHQNYRIFTDNSKLAESISVNPGVDFEIKQGKSNAMGLSLKGGSFNKNNSLMSRDAYFQQSMTSGFKNDFGVLDKNFSRNAVNKNAQSEYIQGNANGQGTLLGQKRYPMLNEKSNMISQSFDLNSTSGILRIDEHGSSMYQNGGVNPKELRSSLNFMRKTQSTFKKTMGDTIHSSAFVDTSPLLDDIEPALNQHHASHYTKNDMHSTMGGFQMSKLPKSRLHQSIEVASRSGLEMMTDPLTQPNEDERLKMNKTIMDNNSGKLSKPNFLSSELSGGHTMPRFQKNRIRLDPLKVIELKKKHTRTIEQDSFLDKVKPRTQI